MTELADEVRQEDRTHFHTPYRWFTDPDVYALEQSRIYRGATWSFLGMAAETPRPGDYKSTFVGDTPVVMTRTKTGEVVAWVNRCAHRGATVCRFSRGNATKHTCVYHQWSYDAAGQLRGVPFRRGYEEHSGMPKDFDPREHSLQRLRVEQYHGLVFATFDQEMESLADYLGPQMRPWMDRLLADRELVYLGCTRQYSHSNWKLYFENVKDLYHASLLHLFHTTFNIMRVSMACTR
jgi:anthranilate 1,2-dioxygenase large subunit